MLDDQLLEERRDQVRSHPLRLKILALLNRKGQSLLLKDLRRELPEHPSSPVIKYHLLVLHQVELLPTDWPDSTERTLTQLEEWLDRQ